MPAPADAGMNLVKFDVTSELTIIYFNFLYSIKQLKKSELKL
jgi:hypothetical protein